MREADVCRRKESHLGLVEGWLTWVVPRETPSRPICGREVFCLDTATGKSMTVLKTKSSQLISLAIFLLAFAVYALSPATTSTDSAYTFHIAASILQDGDIVLDEYSHLMDLKNDYRVIVVRDHIYSYYPSAIPLLAVPAVWAANIFFPLHYPTDFYTYLKEHKPDQRTAKLEKLIASLICALSAVVMYLIARFYLDTRPSLLLVFIFAFATPMYSTSSRALWQHGPSALALALSLYFLICSERESSMAESNKTQPNHELRMAMFAAVCLALSYIIRPTNSLSVALLSLYVLINRRKYFVHFMVVMASIFFLFMIHSWTTYGSLLPPYSFQLFNRFGTPSTFINAFAGLLVSPNRGLLIFSPVFFFSFYGIYLLIKEKKFNLTAFEPYLLAIFILHWLLTSTFDQWDGGWTLGPRYMADLAPYLTFFLIPVFGNSNSLLKSLSTLPKTILAVSVIVSIMIQGYVSISPYPFWWSGKPESLVQVPSRVWDWSDLLFLRGTCRDNPIEGKAPACWFEE